ncbi:putative aarF domain-containing protein kinase 2 [Halocaridina rubra]|uniref:AarF domain-containing protein kinase 2 n=1 Tax=Halocaridina rubra TaxID=373956 RepID=A0AAN9AGA0_HALRR
MNNLYHKQTVSSNLNESYFRNSGNSEFWTKTKQRLIGKITSVSADVIAGCFSILFTEEIKKPKRKDALKSFILSTYNLIRLILRALRLLVTFTPIFCIYPVTYLGERPKDFWWGLLLKAIEFSGPIVIKLGQWISTRRDLFPDTCCTQFAHLQRRIPPHSWSFTVYRMRKAFGPNWRRVFVKFDNNRNPIGSGCVAQVYKVWMSKDAIPDEELLAEMISELDDENTNTAFEGLEIQGFKKFFGFDDEEDKVQEQAITDWRKNRDEMRLRKEDIEAGVQLHPESDLVTGGISKEDIQPSNESQKSEIADTEMEVLEHSLVEVWEEADLDKSLPVEDAPPEDLDGLIPVAVKILHPSVHSYFRRDLKILQACAIFITALYPPLKWLSLPQCVNEFAEVMSGQINLRKEADNLELFTENFADIPSIRFPRPLRPYVTQKVMVETFEDGAGMGDFIGSSGGDKPNELKIHLAQIGVDALLKMVFLDNFVHGDLHPGNMLIQNINLTKDGNLANTGDITRIMMVDVGCDTFVMDVKPDPNPMRICLLDCGVVAKLREQDLVNFKAVFKQVVLGDGRSVADLFLENSEHKCKNPEAFKAEMTELVATARQDTISLAQVDVGVLLQQVLGILLRHEVRLESAFSSVVLAVFVLEGLGRALDPNMDILERARPMLVDAAIH